MHIHTLRFMADEQLDYATRDVVKHLSSTDLLSHFPSHLPLYSPFPLLPLFLSLPLTLIIVHLFLRTPIVLSAGKRQMCFSSIFQYILHTKTFTFSTKYRFIFRVISSRIRTFECVSFLE